ncbi:MAG TPA: amidohydrolase family protein, partial [Thermomicrobiales bacterium]|nr:amidohydrolase family protein [Thermomicrobiales bacterium]
MTDTTVLLNGNVRTCADGVRGVEAVAIRGERILAVGNIEEVRAAAGPDAELIDLDGATVIPGLIDPHNHLLATGQVLGEISLYDVRSIGELQARVREAVDDASPRSWLLGRGWDETLLREERMPSRHDLDVVAPHNPVVLERVWNKLVVNTAALRALGIDQNTPDPPKDMNYAGGFDREEDGYPTGIFRDRAKDLVRLAMPQPSESDLVRAIARGSRAYNSLGVTSIIDPGLLPHQIDAFHRAADAG